MVVTENQAAERWCVHMRHATVQIVPVPGRAEAFSDRQVAVGNVYPQGEEKPIQRAGCIGSKCMSWRWYDGSKSLGYCGLAGDAIY